MIVNGDDRKMKGLRINDGCADVIVITTCMYICRQQKCLIRRIMPLFVLGER